MGLHVLDHLADSASVEVIKIGRMNAVDLLHVCGRYLNDLFLQVADLLFKMVTVLHFGLRAHPDDIVPEH